MLEAIAIVVGRQKIYIVGAITGVENWGAKFIEAEAKVFSSLKRQEIRTPLDYPMGLTQKEYMVLSCESVFWADKILVTKGWENSKGTKAEIALAESFGLPVEYL